MKNSNQPKNSNSNQNNLKSSAKSAWEYIKDPEVYWQLKGICEPLVKYFREVDPGYEAQDLLAEALLRISKNKCVCIGAFVNLFKLAAKSRIIEKIRVSNRKLKYVGASVDINSDNDHDDTYDCLEYYAAQKQFQDQEDSKYVQEIVTHLSNTTLNKTQTLVLDAIIEEATTGHHVPIHEIAEKAGVTVNNISKVKSALLKKLRTLINRTSKSSDTNIIRLAKNTEKSMIKLKKAA